MPAARLTAPRGPDRPNRTLARPRHRPGCDAPLHRAGQIVLALLGIGAVSAVIIAWFAILVTGHYPRGIFDFVEGVMRWSTRVTAYAFTLVTDEYPSFRLHA